MKILQIHNYYQTSGGEGAVVAAEKALLEQHGHEVEQFCKHSKDIESYSLFAKMAAASGIPHNAKVSKELLRFVSRAKPDVAHVHNIFPLLSPAIYSALFDAGIPVVQTHHNYRLICPNGLLFHGDRICEDCKDGFLHCVKKKCVRENRLFSFLYALAIWRGWRKAVFLKSIKMHIALNGVLRDKLISMGMPESNISLCGNFIFNFAGETSQKDGYFLYLGRLSKEKGLLTLLKSIQMTDASLKIAGTGPIEKSLREYAAEHGLSRDKVDFLGFVRGEEKDRVLKKAKAVIIPSEWHESFPISAVEALAQGTPIIASRLGGLPDLITHGENGFLFTPGDCRQLADLINTLFQTPGLSESMGEKALAGAKKTLGPETHYRRLIEIYLDAINKIKSPQT